MDFPVLVPEWVPAPFEVEPAVNTWTGHYGLYWVITGGPPTFLEITGEVGGDIPDYSWYDRNVELTVNADVGGVPAYRDLTPIYDNVYWQVDDVVYTVSSRAMEDGSSLTLANALVRLEPPATEPSTDPPVLLVSESVMSGEPLDIEVRAGGGATLSADLGTFAATGEATYPGVTDETVRWVAPPVQNERAVTFTLTDPESGAWLAGTSTVILAPANPSVPLALDCPVAVSGGGTAALTATGGGDVVVEAETGTFPASGANVGFDGAGTSRLVGTLSASGPTTLTWRAPETAGTGSATIHLSGMSGANGDRCTIQVSGTATAPQSTTTPSVTGPVATRQAAQDPTATARTDGTSAPGTDTVPPPGTNTPRAGQATERPSGDGTGMPVVSGATEPASAGEVAGTATGTEGAQSSAGGRTRYPSSDGTGGVTYPRYDGVDDREVLAVGGMAIMPAPTNAPMPEAPPTLAPNMTRADYSGAARGGPSSPAGQFALWLTVGCVAVGGLAAGRMSLGSRR